MALAVAAPSAPSRAAATPDLNRITPDPAVRFGTLANGLRFAVMRNAAPKGGVSIRLGIEAGSFDEDEGERGVAHLVEHLAFEDTRSFPGEDLLKAFAAKGVAFGQDQNAQTTLYSTTYQLDLPSADPESLDLGARWLREVADGVAFRPEKIERERRVVLAERSVRDTPDAASLRAETAFRERGLRSGERPVVGVVADVSAVGREQIKAFYDKWYRPDNAIVVVVGDLPVEELERRIRDGFSSWTPRGAAPARAPYGEPDEHRGEEVFVHTDDALAARVGMCRVHAARWAEPHDVARLRRLEARAIWVTTLNARLAQAANVSDPPFTSARASVGGGREAESACLAVSPINGDWARGLKAADLELRRLAADGITDDELDHALEKQRSYYRGDVTHAGTRASESLAEELLGAELDHDVFASPQEDFRAFDDAVEGLTPADVLSAFKTDWSGAGPLLIANGPTPPDAQALRLAWDGDAAAPLVAEGAKAQTTASAAVAPKLWSYSKFGAPGRVVERKAFTAPEFVRLTFRNGVVVNFKSTKFAANSVLVRVRFGYGRAGLAAADVPLATFGAGFFKIGGVGRHDFQEIQSIFHEEAWDATLSMGPDAFLLRGDCASGALGDQLEILTAYVTDPGFNPLLDARIVTGVKAAYRYLNNNALLAASEALTRTYAPALSLPPQDVVEKMKAADLARLLKPVVTQSPLEITIVGDVDEATVVRLVARTFGALPARKAAAQIADGGGWLRFPNSGGKDIHVTHGGASDKAAVLAVWPLYVATPERRREELALQMVAELLTNSLSQRVRRELGFSYDPKAATVMPDHADQGYLMVSVETSPDAAKQVATETRAAAERLAKGEITAEAVEQVRKPFLAKWAQRVQSNAWWLGDLDGSARRDHTADTPEFYEQIYASLSLAEIRKAAADWLTRDPIIVTAAPAAAPAKPATN